jgi:hypothetical protein
MPRSDEPTELFRGHDAADQLVTVFPIDNEFVLEAGTVAALRLARVTPGFLTELAACMKRGA